MSTNDTPLHVRQAEGLRALADMVEGNPELGELLSYSLRHISEPATSEEDPKAALAIFARAAAKSGAKVVKDGGTKWFHVVASWGPISVDVFGDREVVCERVVTGTETVTKSVPDPDALAAVPTVEVTEEVETVKWVCGSLLATNVGEVHV